MEETQIKKKYGVWTAIAMVVGTVIGCGVYIKGADVLKNSNGNLLMSLLAWLIGGIIMVVGGFCFAKFATKVSKFGGLIDYVEVAGGKKNCYFVSYFLSLIYYPLIGASVAIVASEFICKACGNIYYTETINELGQAVRIDNWYIYLIAILFIVAFNTLNYFAPIIASKFQITILAAKLIPLLIVITVGLFASLIFGPGHSIADPFVNSGTAEGQVMNFGEAVKITSFAYDGWICATALNGEMKNSKRDLPRALVGGTIGVVIFYLLYFICLSASLTNTGVVISGMSAPANLFFEIFGKAGEIILSVFIFLSVLGNTNAMVICSTRSFAAMGLRRTGFIPDKMGKFVNGKISIYPYIFTTAIMILYVGLWALANYKVPFFEYLAGMDNMVCSILYLAFIFVYIYIMRKFKDLNTFSRFIMPILAICGSLFFAFCSTGLYQLIATHDPKSLISFLVFLSIMVLVFIPGIVLYVKNQKLEKDNPIIEDAPKE